jgi:Zn finger protein HypA/HybF involved in hydrogenase expression
MGKYNQGPNCTVQIKQIKYSEQCNLCKGKLVATDVDLVCRQCGSSDFAEIKSDIPDFSPELEEQIIKRDVVLRCTHHGNAALQCNGCGKWGYDRNKLDSNLVRNLDGENISGNCPECNSTYYSEIIWGYPDPFAMEFHRERGDDVIFGGCCLPSDNPPDKSCNNCGHQW